ncbi:MAG: hypothetical protein AB7F96_06875 [Beijerinckiaceae bacterium]
MLASAVAAAAAFFTLALPSGPGAGLGIAPAAAQSSCQIDFGILTKKRLALVAALNKDAKRRKGKLDPRTACPKFRALAAAEGAMLSYMKKNKNWCGIPDEPIKQIEATRQKTVTIAGQACKAAKMMNAAIAKAKRMQQQQAAGAAAAAPPRPKLPSGPL